MLAQSRLGEEGSEERDARNIDDMLISDQNSTAGYLSTHIPMTVDAMGAHFRCVRERFPRSRLGGHPSDFAKAYKQCSLGPARDE